MKKVALKEGVEWYWVNGYRGWNEVKSGLFLQIKDSCTINKHLDGEIVTDNVIRLVFMKKKAHV